MNARLTIVAILAAGPWLGGCDVPEKARVAADFEAMVHETLGRDVNVAVLDVAAGEGDAENVYFVVHYSLSAARDIDVRWGLFKGLSLKSGIKRAGPPIEILYQYSHGDCAGKSQWCPTSSYQATP